MKLEQLELGDHEKYIIFLEMLFIIVCENDFDVGKIMFRDKAHFDLHGKVKK